MGLRVTKEGSMIPEILEHRESHLENYVSSVQILLSQGEYRLAESLARESLERFGPNPDLYRSLALSLKEQGDLSSALSCATKYHDLFPGFESLFLLGDLYYQVEDFEKALPIYIEGLMNAPYVPDVLFSVYKNVGNIYLRLGDLDSAEENYNRANSLNPHSPVLYVNIGTLEIQRGNFEEAGAAFRQALLFDSKSSRAWTGLALIHQQMGDVDLAWANLEQALDLDPSNATAMNAMLEWGTSCHRWDSIIDRSSRYLEKNASDAKVVLARAQIFFLSGQAKRAEQEAKKAILLDSTLSEAEAILSTLRLKEQTLRQSEETTEDPQIA